LSGLDDNLKVLTEHLNDLAGKQQSAAGQIIFARDAVVDVTGSVWRTHGAVCAATNLAIGDAETARAAAVSHLYKMSADLRDRLNSAAQNYNNSDWRAGRDIGSCGL